MTSIRGAGRRLKTNWSRSLRFLTTELANASFRTQSQNVALLAAGAAKDELQVERVVLRIQPSPQEPHSATADFDLVRLAGRERGRAGALERIDAVFISR